MNFQTVEANNGNLVDMFGTFAEIGGAQSSTGGKLKSICKITDDAGVTHTVHIHQGKGRLPGPALLQQRCTFSLSTYQGSYQGNPYTGYSGFWKDQAQVRQPPPQQPQQGVQQPHQGVQKEKGEDMVKVRSMALAYAKDLVCEGKTDISAIPSTANEFTAFIISGQWFSKKPQGGEPNPDYEENPGPPPDDDVPF